MHIERRVVVVTWNLLGSQRPDMRAVASYLDRIGADVVMLQEVQRRQVRELALLLGGWNHRWVFKHWPVRVPAEGLAVLTAQLIARRRRVVLRRAVWWSWRRRVALLADVELPSGSLTLATVHLSPHDDEASRVEEVRRLERAIVRFDGRGAVLVVGDLNDSPGGPAHTALLAAGRCDAWAMVHGDQPEPAGATNWTAGPRRDRPPTQRLDHVVVPAGWGVVSAHVVPSEDPELSVLAELSDHLPLTVTVTISS